MSNNVIDNDNPSLETVNQNLLRKLNEAIEAVGAEEIGKLLEVTEAVAKLNASSKNNDQLGALKSEKEKVDEELTQRFKQRLGEGEIVGG